MKQYLYRVEIGGPAPDPDEVWAESVTFIANDIEEAWEEAEEIRDIFPGRPLILALECIEVIKPDPWEIAQEQWYERQEMLYEQRRDDRLWG